MVQQKINRTVVFLLICIFIKPNTPTGNLFFLELESSMSSSEKAEIIFTITSKFQFSFSVILLIFGIIDNILLIPIFTTSKIFRANRSAFYLSTESITNIGVLLAVLPSNIAEYILKVDSTQASLVWCKLQLMSSYCFGFYSLYTICFLALDQYLSTNYRVTWRQKTTLQLAHRLTLINITLPLIHGILFLIFGEIGAEGCSIYQRIAKMYFTFFFYPILSSLLPFFVSSLFSLLAYRNVRRIVRRQIPLVRRRLDQQMTAIALARVICIISLGAPFIVASLIALNLDYAADDYLQKAIINAVLVTTTLLLYSNFSVSNYN